MAGIALLTMTLASFATESEEIVAGFSEAEISEGKRFCDAAGSAPQGVMSNSSPLKTSDKDYQRFQNILPEPPAGWKLKSESAEAFSTDTIGCGVQARWVYETAEGEAILGIQLIPAFVHPPFSEAIRGLDAGEKIAGQQVLALTEDSITLIVGRIMVTAAGSASESNKRAMLGRVDFDAVKRAGAARP